MPHYRVYILDGNGHLVAALKFDCADDEEARERAKQLDAQNVELWRHVPLPDSDSTFQS